MDITTLYTLFSEHGFSFSTDTRTVKLGDIYFGLKGENFDGNEYAQVAIEKGAAFAIIDNAVFKKDDRYIVVANSLQTLQDLAKHHRTQFSNPFLVIGGSNGKTTTKELVHAVLSTQYKVHTTEGNLNNEIGVPITLLSLPKDTDIAVIEIGANHAQEHTLLMEIVSPTHVLVTNNGADHLEGFGTIEGVRAANKEIFDSAEKLHAHAFVNALLSDLVNDSHTLERTLYPEKEFFSTSTQLASVQYDGTTYQSTLFGSFNEANILAAIIVGQFFSVSIQNIQSAITDYVPTLKRSQVIEKNGHTLILDCYNANPTSMELSLKDFFRSTPAGSRVAIVGDMFEVGVTEDEAHRAILILLDQSSDPSDRIICVGPRFLKHKDSFPFTFFTSAKDAKPFYSSLLLQGKTIFLKASRGIHLETILE